MFSRLQHMLWATNTPETFKDWDTADGNREAVIGKWWAKYREITVMQLLHLLSNLALLGPLINTGEFFIQYNFVLQLEKDELHFFPFSNQDQGKASPYPTSNRGTSKRAAIL